MNRALNFYNPIDPNGSSELGGWAPIWSGGGSTLPPVLTQTVPTWTPTTFPTFPGQQTPNVIVVPANQQTQNSGGGNSNFSQYFNTVASLVSQFLSRGGNRETNQLVAGQGGVTSIPNAPQVQMIPVGAGANQQISPGGGGLESGISSVTSLIAQNPGIFMLMGLGALLWFAQSPRSSRR